MSVSERLKQARKEKGCSSDDTAKACKITRSAVQMYEAGMRIPRDSVKIAMANFYGKSVQELFF